MHGQRLSYGILSGRFYQQQWRGYDTLHKLVDGIRVACGGNPDEPDGTHMTVFNPDEKLLELIKNYFPGGKAVCLETIRYREMKSLNT